MPTQDQPLASRKNSRMKIAAGIVATAVAVLVIFGLLASSYTMNVKKNEGSGKAVNFIKEVGLMPAGSAVIFAFPKQGLFIRIAATTETCLAETTVKTFDGSEIYHNLDTLGEGNTEKNTINLGEDVTVFLWCENGRIIAEKKTG